MKIISLLISGFVIVLGVIFGKNSETPTTPSQLGIETEASPSSRVPEETQSPSATVTPTNTVTPKYSPTPTHVAPKPEDNTLNDFQYPGSSITSQTKASIILSSNDDATKITNWYSAQLKNTGFNALSTARTNTNGNILNKISGGKSGQQITITVQKSDTSETVTITISNSVTDSQNNSVHLEINNTGSSI